MKKTLAVAAVLAAFAGSAAADVTVYGKFDMGLGMAQVDGDTKVQMKSGGSAASRLGFKGSEKIGDMTVGFTYETAFTADDGNTNVKNVADDKYDRMWTRQASLNVKGAYGEVAVGYYGALDAATGSWDYVGGLSAMGTGYFDIGGQDKVFKTRARMENSFTYVAPTFAGLTVAAQAASESVKDAEFTDDADMLYGLGAKYAAGDFGAGLVVTKAQAKNGGDEDINVTAGVNYNFGVAKVFLAANYYEDGVAAYKGDSFGVVASAVVPVLGGELQLQAGYGEKDMKDVESETTFAGAFYKYPLSKQTYVYGAAGWDQVETLRGETVGTVDAYRGIVGLCHNF